MNSKISLILFFVLSSCIIYAQKDIQVISSDQNSLVFKYTPIYLDTTFVQFENQEFRNIDIYYGVSDENFSSQGLPDVKRRLLTIGVPAETGNTIEILNSSYKELNGKLLPIPTATQDTSLSSLEFKIGGGYYNYESTADLATFGVYGIARGIRTQQIILNPVQFYPDQNKSRIYTSVTVKVNFRNGNSFSESPADNFLEGSLVNFNVARSWNLERPKRLNKMIQNSVLAAGNWVRFEAPEEGIYKITRSQLSSFGIDAATVDPRTIKIFNNGGKVLSEDPNRPRPVDLVENPILIIGEEDGKFDENDYILFYGRGIEFWDYDSSFQEIRRFFHPYSKENFYWITSGGDTGLRMEEKASLNTTPGLVQNSTVAFASLEEEKINIGKTGRQFLGDDFSQAVTTRTYTNILAGRLNSYPINYEFSFVVGSSAGLDLTVTENGNSLLSRSLSGYGGSSYTVGRRYTNTMTYTGSLPPDNRSALTFNVVPSSITAVGYLDYLEIDYVRSLTATDDNILFYSADTSTIIEYFLNGFSSTNIKVFDCTDYNEVKMITNFNWLSGGECKFQVNESENDRSKYIALSGDKYKTPVNPVEISNSNLRGEEQGTEFIIVTHKNFLEAANNLKTHRETGTTIPISTTVVDIDKVYNEFSGGLTDVSALRDYFKHAYDNWQIRPKYVLLFGKGTYDYKDILGFGDNYVLTWQSTESLYLINSYTTDDFFVRVDGNDNVVDIALGRLPLRSLTHGTSIVNKIIEYEIGSEKGNWRNLITLVADDGYTSSSYEGTEHTYPSEQLSKNYTPPAFNFKKIYSAAYPDVLTSAGRRKPEVNKAIIDAVNEGTLLMNYIGHGSPELWAHEVIFERSVTIPQFVNDKYFFLCAATCDFGYFDIPNFESASETMLFLPDAGSIGSFTATRLVYSNVNHILNYRFFDKLLNSPRDTLNLPIPMGIASFKTKLELNSVNDQKYNIFGDPTLRLNIPQHDALIDSVNGIAVGNNIQIKALSKTRISGEVLRPGGSKWTDFSGEGLLTVFDSERDFYIESINYTVKLQGGVIFRGRVSINGGEFDAEFVVPKDISYENNNGKINFYFFNSNSDGLGYNGDIVVGGTDTTTVNDGDGPDIEIYFDDEAFANAFLVSPNSTLLVDLMDETGINTTGTGVGHKLEGILNEKEADPIDFTNYFIGDLDAGGKSGKIKYPFSSLSHGEYSIQVKAWDVFNNFSTETEFFSVVDDGDLVIRDVYNYPNPFGTNTTFTFQHNLTSPIDVKIKVYTIAGRMIKEIEQNNLLDKYVTLPWDGRDEDGSELANGTYLYKLIVNTVSGDYQKSVIGKLAVIR